MIQNKEFARAHLKFLSGEENSVEVFQVYPDHERCGVKARILIGTLDQHFDELVRLNLAGAAISVVVNQTDLKGRKDENVVRIRALFTDDDNHRQKSIQFDPPSFAILSKAGKHKYYVINGLHLEEFKPLQQLLACEAETDPQVCDLGRAMRLAGFFHMKDPHDPFLVRIESEFNTELGGNKNG